MAVLVALIFACVAALGLALASLGRGPEQQRLQRLAGGGSSEAAAESLLKRSELNPIERFVRLFAGDPSQRGEKQIAPLRKRLIHAGYRGDAALATYLGTRAALALLLPVGVLLMPSTWGLGALELTAALGCAAGVGLVAPSRWLDSQVKKRQRALTRALPDALDLMVVCVEAGLGINASLRRIAQDFATTHPILAQELELANFETRAGKSTTDALRGLADRTGVSDVSTLVAMLIQTERFGTSLADTLRVHADAMRLRRLQRAEEMANKAPLKMLFPTVFIFVAMLMVIVGPAFIAFKSYFAGTSG